MRPTEQTHEEQAHEQAGRLSQEAKLDDALDDSFPASDPLAFTPQRAGHTGKAAAGKVAADKATMNKAASTPDVDHPHGVRALVNWLKDRLKH